MATQASRRVMQSNNTSRESSQELMGTESIGDQRIFLGNILTKKEILRFYPWTRIYVWAYIETSYRRPEASVAYCVKSLFTAHNETVNSWTHFAGAFWMIYMYIKYLCIANHGASWLAINSLYFLTCVVLCLFSAVYHMLCFHSESYCRMTHCMDWFAVSLLIFSSNMLCGYNELHKHEIVFAAFTVLNILLMFASFYIAYQSLQSDYELENKKRDVKPSKYIILRLLDSVIHLHIFRVSVYVVYAMGGILSWFIRYLIESTYSDTLETVTAAYACYASVVLNIFHLPERLSPGTFDVIGYSHNIFHTMAVVGMTLMWLAYNEMPR